MLSTDEKVAFLKHSDLFSQVPPEMLSQIAGIMTEVRYVAGDILIKEGDRGDALYLIVEGRIRLEKEDVEIMIRGVGECLGEMALLDEAPRSATVEAITDVIALKLTRDEFQRVLTGSAAMMHGLYHILTRKLRTDLEVHVEAIREQVQMNQDMRRAYETQQTMLPDNDLLHGNIHITGYCKPAASVGGDYYDYFTIPPDYLGLFIGDVSGHGYYSGLVVAMARSCLVTQLEVDPSVESVMQAVNRIIYPTGPVWMFMTVCYALVDIKNRTFTYANAGHNNPYHMDSRTKELVPLKPNTFPVGIMEHAEYKGVERVWHPDDLLVFYSDGVIEAENTEGDMFGAERLEQCIRQANHLSAVDVKQAILQEVDRFTQGVPQLDDITVMVMKM